MDRIQHETPESEHSLLSKPLHDVRAVGYCFSHVDMLVSQSDSSRWMECLIDPRHLIIMMVPKSGRKMHQRLLQTVLKYVSCAQRSFHY